ncbi:hypothetical protein BV898_14996 [Hypsibius exemplaris]|uniref:Uncharacterized protein n=1 Tax=Hypsibius exemplaris TaxID=2072580 RepID=A0A9X6RK31_HYPEX|nr:hypothetical protein BV898_14996 [Hypsibius exemplaris]
MDDSSRISNTLSFLHQLLIQLQDQLRLQRDALKKAFPGNPNMRYTEYNCTDDALINGVAQWRETDGVVKKFFDLSRRNEIVTSCAFYETQLVLLHGEGFTIAHRFKVLAGPEMSHRKR